MSVTVTTEVDGLTPTSASGVVRPDLEDAPRSEAGADGGGAAKFHDNGGPVIKIPRVQLVYWGSAWASSPSPTPSHDQVTAAVRAMLAGPYMTGLKEYRQVGRGHMLGATVISSSNPPRAFQDADIANFIDARINDGTLPGPDQFNQNLYMVVLPRGVSPSNPGFIGEHTYFTHAGGTKIHYAWITNNGNLSSITSILSHELVESCTDPEGSSVLGVAGTCAQSGWCEIGDVCGSTAVRNGVTVQSFWSDAAGECIVPSWPALRLPSKGVQFQGHLPAGATQRWYTFNWPEYLFVLWQMTPRAATPGGPALAWHVAIERASGAYVTYWITVTNLSSNAIDFDGRYTILGIPN